MSRTSKIALVLPLVTAACGAPIANLVGPTETPTPQYPAQTTINAMSKGRRVTLPAQLMFVSTPTGFKSAQDVVTKLANGSGEPVGVTFTIDDKSAGTANVRTFKDGLDLFAKAAMQNTAGQSFIATFGTSAKGVQYTCGPLAHLAAPANAWATSCTVKTGLFSTFGL